MKRLATYGGLAIVLGAAGFWFLSAPNIETTEPLIGDAEHGEEVTTAMGCASCHGEDLGGGLALGSPFGVFHVPNITPSAIGDWSETEILVAVRDGVAPDGSHYYPVFPYRNYAQTTDQDAADLVAYLKTVDPVERANKPHDLSIIAAWRRPVGIWKRLAGEAPDVDPTDRGQYLSEAMLHCQECHTPRNALGITQYSRAYHGGELYGVDGKIKTTVPSLLDGDSAAWSRGEVLQYLSTGFTPEFDTASAEMVDVVENIGKLPREDQEAITDYVLSLRASPSQ